MCARRLSKRYLGGTIDKVCLLVSATSTGGMERLETPGGRVERSDLMASNSAAFGIIQSLLAECTPPVEAVCLQVRACGCPDESKAWCSQLLFEWWLMACRSRESKARCSPLRWKSGGKGYAVLEEGE